MAVPILTRDELLDTLKLKQIIEDAANQTLAIIELKEQAKGAKLPSREFNALIKEVIETDGKMTTYTPKAFIFPNTISDVIINLADYMIDEDGVKLQLDKYVVDVCPHPLLPIRIMKDITTGEEKVQLAYYKKTCGWVTDVIVDRVLIATAKGVTSLARFGIMANDENSRYIVKFLCDIEMANIDTLQVVKSCGHLGKTDYGWVPYSKDIIYNMHDKDLARRYALYKSHGDFHTWCAAQVEIFKYTIPKICIATSYASLLCETFGLNPFAVHLWGETGKGKSVAMLSAASVYGYPDIKNGIVYTGNSTANGLEPRLAFVRNFTFFLDELSMKTSEQINQMIYLAMQGQGKARMTQGAKAQETYYWYLCMLSNAEMPITSDYAKGGIFNRVIQIMPEGKIFGNLDMPQICEIFKNNYGFGAELFIRGLKIISEAEIKQIKDNYYNQIINLTEDKQAHAASVLLTAFELARRFIYLCDETLTVEDIKPYLFTTDQVSQVVRIYDKFVNWVDANPSLFNDSEVSYKDKYGKSEPGVIHIYPHRLEEFCNTAGIDMKQFIIGLKDRSLLIHRPNANTNRYRIWGDPCVCYSIKKPFISDDVD